MAVHIDFGKLGEELAEKYLLSKGYSILHRNWRYSRLEIDIIALKNELPHFIEVKIRSSQTFGLPEESVTKKKLRSLLKAVDEFLYQNLKYKDFRLDILSITMHHNTEPEFFFIEDVYW